jgi:hypothetical protein
MNTKLALILCLVPLLAFLLPYLLYIMFRSQGVKGEFDASRRAIDSARHPWQSEDKDLKELSERVEALKNRDNK